MQHIEIIESHVSFKGEQRVYKVFSECLGREVLLEVYVPIAHIKEKHCVPIYFLPEMGVSASTVAKQGNYQCYANRYDKVVIIPDLFSSYSGDEQSRLAQYFSERQSVHEFLLDELPEAMARRFNLLPKRGLIGYGFGGLLALNLSFENPKAYRSVSAFAPWLGFAGTKWAKDVGIADDYDPARFFDETKRPEYSPPLWLDQGMSDICLGKQINPDHVRDYIAQYGKEHLMWYRFHKRYDHSFYFVHAYIREHFVFHAHYDELPAH